MVNGNWLGRGLFIGLLMTPYFVLVSRIDFRPQVQWSELFRFLVQAVFQASLSILLILFLGLIIASGLFSLPSRWQKTVQALVCLPAFAPSIFIVVSVQLWLESFGIPQAKGILLVSGIHGLMNAGLFSVMTYYILKDSMTRQIELAFLEGASFFKSYFHALRAKSTDLSLVLISFFGLSFTSFSVPLVFADSTGNTLEILAYNHLSLKGDLSGALAVSLFQCLFFFGLIYPFTRNQVTYSGPGTGIRFLWGSPWSLLPGLFCLLFCCAGLFVGLDNATSQAIELWNTDYPLIGLVFSSAITGLLSACVVGLLYFFVAFLWEDSNLHRWILAFGGLSSVFMGLGFFVLDLNLQVRLSFGLGLLFFPVVYRFAGGPKLLELRQQVQVAQLMGASRLQRFCKILFPQTLPVALRMGALVSVWAMGEFAVTSVITGEIANLAILAKSLMASYRFELAGLVSWVLLVLSGFIFFVFHWSSDVCRRKLEV